MHVDRRRTRVTHHLERCLDDPVHVGILTQKVTSDAEEDGDVGPRRVPGDKGMCGVR